MANFRNTKIKRDRETGKNYYVNTVYPTIPSDSEDAYIRTRNGDRSMDGPNANITS